VYTWLGGLYGNYLVVRESRDTVIFLRTSSKDWVYVSALFSALCGVEYTGEFIEYTLNLSALGDRCIDLCVVNKSKRCTCEVFRVDSLTRKVYYLGELDCTKSLSTGFTWLDAVVKEVCDLRRAWSSVLCSCLTSIVDCYEVFLKARIGHTFSLYRRVKEAWLEYSREYLGFTFSLVHSTLLEYCELTGVYGLREICEGACRAESVEWSNVVVEYKCGDTPIKVYLEKMISGIRPDMLVETPKRRVLIECKQGPVKTWLVKAIKQAKKYRALSNYTILLTPRALSSEELSVLRQHYDIVIEGCTVESSGCRSRLPGEVVRLLGLTPGGTRS